MADRVLNMVAVRYFQEVAKAGSFRGAADRINVAASAINRHVRILEDELGVRLLDRGKGRKGVTLTAAGEVLIRRVSYALNELQLARNEIASLQGVQQGHITIGMTDALAKDLALPMFSRFQEENPNSTYEVVISKPADLIDQLLQDKIDIVLAYDVAPQIGIDFVAEFALESCVVVNRSHPFAGRKSVSLAECTAYPIALPLELPYRKALLSHMTNENGIAPRPLFTTNSYELMRDLAEEGWTISFQANLPVDRTKTHPNVVYVPLSEPLARYSLLSCCVRRGRGLSVSAQLLLRFIDSQLNEIAGPYRMRSPTMPKRKTSERRNQE